MPGLVPARLAFVSALWFGPLSLPAQTALKAPADDLESLQALAKKVKTALQAGDLDAALRLSSELNLAIFKLKRVDAPNAEESFTKLEQSAPPAGKERFYALAGLAKAAFNAGELQRADQYARELLADAPEYPKDWNYGNAIHDGNLLIGRVAFSRDHDLAVAKSSLLAAGQTPGSPQLNSFGPNMSLAKDLLDAGEREVVVEYFTSCRSFWKPQFSKLDEWTATVKGGGIPNFGANLLY